MKNLHLFIIASLLMMSPYVYSNGIENQKKYIINSADKLATSFAKKGGELGIFKAYKHSEYTYIDLYLDTKDFKLYKNKLSLRFRKRDFGNGTYSYGMQLKSEMTKESSARMEIEEKDLKIYKIFIDGKFYPLTQTLDVLFSVAQTNGVYNIDTVNTALKNLDKWIQFKATAAIAPFIKLRRDYDHIDIKQLKVAIIGQSKRMRSHIYSIKNDLEAPALKMIALNQVSKNKSPLFFKNKPRYNWLIETSFDQATFYPMFESVHKSNSITEYEVENKYFNETTGSIIMDMFQKELFKSFDVKSGMDSKFKVSIKKLFF